MDIVLFIINKIFYWRKKSKKMSEPAIYTRQFFQFNFIMLLTCNNHEIVRIFQCPYLRDPWFLHTDYLLFFFRPCPIIISYFSLGTRIRPSRNKNSNSNNGNRLTALILAFCSYDVMYFAFLIKWKKYINYALYRYVTPARARVCIINI